MRRRYGAARAASRPACRLGQLGPAIYFPSKPVVYLPSMLQVRNDHTINMSELAWCHPRSDRPKFRVRQGVPEAIASGLDGGTPIQA